MGKVSSFKISVSFAVPEYERGMLEATLKDVASVHSPKTRAFGVDDYILVVTAIGATAATAKEVGELIEKIVEWRRNIRKKRIEAKAELQSSSKEPLSLESATDQEIREWFNQ